MNDYHEEYEQDDEMNQFDNDGYGLTKQLNNRALSSLAEATRDGFVLNAIVALSAVLSSIFFWQNSSIMFAGLPNFVAIILALLVGAIPNELAFVAWSRIRATQVNMTKVQIEATKWGATMGVAGSLLGTVSLFVTTIRFVPSELAEVRIWLSFLALSLPIVVQVIIYSVYSTNRRSTVENAARAQLSAISFKSHIESKVARTMAQLAVTERMLERELKSGLAERLGARNVSQYLDGVSRQNVKRIAEPAIVASHTEPEDDDGKRGTGGIGFNTNGAIVDAHMLIAGAGVEPTPEMLKAARDIMNGRSVQFVVNEKINLDGDLPPDYLLGVNKISARFAEYERHFSQRGGK